ncbi:MAG: hypothetical protein Q7K28_02790 [Candidatus Wildermuthbacteria bacterium]|nr:hypothetical protein [Candidatus Wildermuthbacteria bacterium]
MVGVLIVIMTTGCDKEISLNDAKEKPELRKDYLSKIAEKIGGRPAYIASINYVGTPKELAELKKLPGFNPDPREAMGVYPLKPIMPENIGKEILPVIIVIFPATFEGRDIRVENDFISAVRHQYKVAEILNRGKIGSIDLDDFRNKKGDWNLSLMRYAIALEATEGEIDSPLKLSSRYESMIRDSYLNLYIKIWDEERGMSPEFIKSLKIEFFKDWILKTPFLIKEGQIWYLKNPQTGRKYFLPDEITKKSGKVAGIKPPALFIFPEKKKLLGVAVA